MINLLEYPVIIQQISKKDYCLSYPLNVFDIPHIYAVITIDADDFVVNLI
jgi:hypothetical protein